ncbi:MAG: hypothetical protein A3A30_05170 [Candidatus Terrybacteria bacterium RIFCSPLOWO2_01_FULL_48_14]|nr:MAG: hypothetical protein A3A30_05170 [Candidatus Terrybacteria bacterium RIFCSPLOWO2_01_FULL_48_14]
MAQLSALTPTFFCAKVILPRAFAQNDAALRYLETRLYGFVGFSFRHARILRSTNFTNIRITTVSDSYIRTNSYL